MSNQKTVVISDIHGHSEKLHEAINYYGEESHYVINGDFINRGPDSRGVIDILSKLNATILTGNHEWVLMASLDEADEDQRNKWTNEVWLESIRELRMEDSFLESYGISRYQDPGDIQAATKEKLKDLGHYDLLAGLSTYYEDAGIVAVHAGLKSSTSWQTQKEELDLASSLKMFGTFQTDLPQLFDFNLSQSPNRPRDLGKTLVTGHSTLRKPAEDRIIRVGTQVARVMLASNLAGGDELFAYEGWESTVRAF